MTEENKENCNFQQNYNVFGLDDKPCCYLYHKYCGEIDSCYFKRCKRLEQENETLNYQWHKQYEIADEWYKVAEKYKSTLEEIREIAKFNLFYNPDCFSINGDIGQIQNLKMTEIYNKIIEVLQ